MSVQHIGKYKCVHNPATGTKRKNLSLQTLKNHRNQRTSQKASHQQSQREKSDLQRRSQLKRNLWCLIVCAYYFGALYFNESLYSLNHSAYNPEVILTKSEWENYFFNACLIAISCLAFIALTPGAATRGEKAYCVTYFLSLVMSALMYDDASNGWWWLNELDIAMQYGITAVLILITGLYLCRLLRFCCAYLVLYFYE